MPGREGELLLIGLIVLVSAAMACPSPASASPDPVSTYYEYATTVVNGTALNSPDNLDVDDGVYYEVDCGVGIGSPQIFQPITNGNFTSDASGWNWTLVSGVDIFGDWENTGQSGGSVYIDVKTRNEKGESYWNQNFTLSQANPESVTLNHQWKCGVFNTVDSCTIKLQIAHPNGTVFDLWTQDITGTTAWSGILSISVNTGIFDQTGTYQIRLWDYTDLGNSATAETKVYYDDVALTLQFPAPAIYEVNAEHTSGQVAECIANITQIFFEDNFKFNASATAYLEWFNWTANAWTGINSGTVGPTEVTWNKTWTSGFSDVINATGYMKVRIYTVNESNAHRLLEDYLHWDVTYIAPDITPPAWSNAGTNNTLAGQPTLFHVKWTDNVALSGFIFGTNNTGTWTNDTWTPMSGTTDWSNVTKILNSIAGVVVQWRVWANDTSNNWNDTGILSLTTTTPPVASFTYSPLTPYTDETVTFNASASYDPDGTIVSYFWDFGDGTNGTGEITTHAFADNGTYTVTLTVTDNDGLSDTTSEDITVLNRAPVAIFTESAETVDTGEVIHFNATQSYDPDGSIVSYLWDFGDGTNATGVIVDHSYADDGNYTVTLTVTDDDGATALASATKTILNRSPVAIFTESATTVFTDEIIYFNASDSYDPDGSIVSYFWDFGDGANATGVTVEHAYADDGNYTVTLTVTDDDGATDVATSTKTVLNRPPVASFTESAETVYTSDVITFNASASYDPDGSIVTYFWDFGDGTNATGVVVDHSYADNGNYTVTLTVTDDDGATDTATAIKTVLNRPPVASFTESAETVYTEDTIFFNASDSHDPDGYIISYLWNFGDGTNGTGVTVDHSYADDGNYTVTLTVTDDDGATDTTTSTKTVLNRSPVAIFTESAETVYTGEAISFNASASYDPDGTIVSYFWDFGDGTNATGVVVEHAYVDDGVYNVTLTVTDNDGATDTATSKKTVLNRPPVASFTESAETVSPGEIIYFNASDSYDPDGSIISYFWDFGDGTNDTGVTVEHAYSEVGNYTVTLTVTDDDGATDTATSTKTVTIGFDLNLHVKDWDLTDNISGAYVYVNSDVKISDANGWANWTTLTGTVFVKVKWYGAWVNGTFSVVMDSDKTIDVKCNIFDILVTCTEGVQSAILQYVNVTVYNGTSVPSNKIRTGITNSSGKVSLANVPNSTLTLTCYDGASPSHIIANVTRTITTENQAETITCDQNYVSTTNKWGIIAHDCDGKVVDYRDLFALAAAYGTKKGQPSYNPDVDFDADGDIDYNDLFILAANYGREVKR